MEAQYDDPRLVALYDALNAGDDDHAFWLRRIGPSPRRVIDLGCGTGVLARKLAVAGHNVTGIEPADAMLDLARSNDPAGRVTWLQGMAQDIPAGEKFDVAVMAGHVFQCFLDDGAALGTLIAVRHALQPGGTLLFDSRNPARRPWEAWTPERSRRVTRLPDGHAVETSHGVFDVDGALVRFRTTYRLGKTVLENVGTLRFRSADEVLGLLASAAFDDVELIGDWDGAPFDPATSDEIIVSARLKSTAA